MVEACLARAAEVGMALVMVAETLVGDMAKVTAVEGEGERVVVVVEETVAEKASVGLGEEVVKMAWAAKVEVEEVREAVVGMEGTVAQVGMAAGDMVEAVKAS